MQPFDGITDGASNSQKPRAAAIDWRLQAVATTALCSWSFSIEGLGSRVSGKAHGLFECLGACVSWRGLGRLGLRVLASGLHGLFNLGGVDSLVQTLGFEPWVFQVWSLKGESFWTSQNIRRRFAFCVYQLSGFCL